MSEPNSVDQQVSYLAKLLEEDSVHDYMLIQDKTGANARLLENDENVKEAQRVIAEILDTAPFLASRLDRTIRRLGQEPKRA